MDKKDLQGIDTLVFTITWNRVNGFEECDIGVGRGDGKLCDETLEAVTEYLLPVVEEQLGQLSETMDAMMIPGVCHCRKKPEYSVTAVEVEEETS